MTFCLLLHTPIKMLVSFVDDLLDGRFSRYRLKTFNLNNFITFLLAVLKLRKTLYLHLKLTDTCQVQHLLLFFVLNVVLHRRLHKTQI